MTYKELKNRLNKCEYALKAIKDGSHKDINTIDVQKTTAQLNIIKENLQAQIKQLKEGNSKTYLVTPEKGQTTAVSLGDDEKDALKDADDVKAIKGIDGEEIKEGIEFSLDETKSIAKKVGKAVAKALKDSGDDVAHMKATNIETNSFEIYVEYKNNSEDSFAFHLSKNKLHLADFSFNKALVDVSVKPSGEPIIHIDVLANELVKHFKSLREDVNEGPHQTTYIKVARSDYKKAMAVLDQNLDPTYVKTDIVDDDGDGNVIIYFNFRAKDDGEPGENVEAFIYDAASDLQAQGIHVTGSSHDIDESTDINDPVLMKMRALKSKIGRKKGIVKGGERHTGRKRELLAKLKAKRAQVMSDMEQEAEPEGGPIADKYGDILNKIDAAIAKASGRKEMDYDTAVGKANEGWNDKDDLFAFGYNLDLIQAVVNHLKSNYSEDDFELHVGRGDTHPNAVTLKNPNMDNDKELGNLLIAAADQEETDYQSGREAEKDYTQMHEDEEEDAKNDADYAQGWHDDPRQDEDTDDYGRPHVDPKGSRTFLEPDEMKPHNRFKKMAQKEDTDIGHQDDEPSMLSATARETAEYSAKLLKKLQAYDQHDGEVDFPNWWQSKLILAREYMSAAFHYLDSEEKQPAIDQLALEGSMNEEYTKQKLLAYLGQADDAMIRTYDDKYLIIYNPKNGNDDNAAMWHDDTVFGVDQDGEEHEVRYDQIDGLQLEDINEESELDKITKAKRLIKQQAPAINKLPQNDPKRIAFINQVKQINTKHKQLLAKQDSKIAGTGRDQELDEGRGDFDDVLKAVENMSNNDDISERDAAAEIVLALADKFQLPVDKNLEDYMQENVDKVAGGIPYRRHGNKVIISEPLDDATKERLMGKAKEHGYHAAPNQAGGITITLKKGTYEGEDTKAINEYASRDLDEIFGALGYRQGFDEFIEDNPGCVEVIMEWIGSIRDFQRKLSDEYSKEELENLGFYYGDIDEAGPGFKHDCAAKVIHKEHGAGNTIPEKHTLVKEGNKYVVTHYDVLFENGNTVLDIPVNELDIKTSNEHWHKGYKKKKK